jgi:hypothetical protein
MAHHHNQRRAKHQDRKSHTAYKAHFSLVNNITGDPYDKQIANALVEQNLGRNSGIGAGDDYCIWSLVRSHGREVGWSTAGVAGLAKTKSLVSIHQRFERLVRGRAAGRRISGFQTERNPCSK